MANVHAYGKALEDSMKLVQALSEACHFEIERLGEVLRRTDAKLRVIQQNPVVKVVYRYHTVRRLLRRSGVCTGDSRSLTDPSAVGPRFSIITVVWNTDPRFLR